MAWWGGPLPSSGTVGEGLSGANKGLHKLGGVPVHGGQWWGRGEEVVGIKASSRYDSSPSRLFKLQSGRGWGRGSPVSLPLLPQLGNPPHQQWSIPARARA